jgi:cysteinyl-tRNA synthetase
LQEEALQCRTIARQYALANREDQEKFTDKLKYTLANLCEEMDRSTNTCFIFAACHEFHQRVSDALMDESNQASKNKAILKACDELRNQLRGLGIEVTDVLKSPKRRKQ